MSILINILLVIEVLICLLLILLVLMQRPKNEGLGAAFGGGMTENLFGAQTTNVLQTFTRNLGLTFFVVTALLSWLSVRQSTQKTGVQKALSTAPVPVAATPAPATPPGGAATPAVTSGAVKLDGVPATENKENKAEQNPPSDTKPTTDGDKKANPTPEAEKAPAPAPATPDTKPADAKPADSKPAEPAPTPEAPKPAGPAK